MKVLLLTCEESKCKCLHIVWVGFVRADYLLPLLIPSLHVAFEFSCTVLHHNLSLIPPHQPVPSHPIYTSSASNAQGSISGVLGGSISGPLGGPFWGPLWGGVPLLASKIQHVAVGTRVRGLRGVFCDKWSSKRGKKLVRQAPFHHLGTPGELVGVLIGVESIFPQRPQLCQHERYRPRG